MDRVFHTPIKQMSPISDAKHLVTKEYLEQKRREAAKMKRKR